MTSPHFPRLPYDQVQSTFIKEQIRTGAFEDLDRRGYVNDLVYIEWYTDDGLSPHTTGWSAFGASLAYWRIAARYPDGYDAVRQDLGAETRAEQSWGWSGDEDPNARRHWARRHRAEWQAVQSETTASRDTGAASCPLEDRPSFAPFRFPKLPYNDVESAFITDEIHRGAFDDLEHRQYVNKLVWIEADTTDQISPTRGSLIRHCRIAAEHPDAYDILREELEAPPRVAIDTRHSSIDDRAPEEQARQHKRAWRRVQERSLD